MADTQANSYLAYRLVRTGAQMRLFCFPYAGGSAAIFRTWQRAFPESIEVCPLQYPGRGHRIREDPFMSVGPLAAEISRALLPLLDLPFAFFGHSMGALIAFEATRDLRRMQKPTPLHLFVSASRAPQLRSNDRVAYDLPKPEFIEELRRLNGTPPEVLENTELMELMLPMLRADFSAAQTYNYFEEPRLSCPISVYGGTEDQSVSIAQLEGWRAQTTNSFSLQLFRGDHFYIHASQALVTAKIVRQLDQFSMAHSGR